MTNALRAFIIGLPDAYRGKELEAQLERHSIEWSFSSGVTVALDKCPTDVFCPAAARRLLRRPMVDGEVGCSLAHRRVYETMEEQKMTSAIVLEDDARLIAQLPMSELASFLLRDEPAVVCMSYLPSTAIAYRDQLRVPEQSRFIRLAVHPTLTTAYALNLAAARVLSNAATPVTYVADWPIKAISQVKFYALPTPAVIPLPREQSTISGRNEILANGQSRAKAWWRRFAAASHLTWIRYGRDYGRYYNYIMHELVRNPAFVFGEKVAAAAMRKGQPPAPVRAPRWLDHLAGRWR